MGYISGQHIKILGDMGFDPKKYPALSELTGSEALTPDELNKALGTTESYGRALKKRIVKAYPDENLEGGISVALFFMYLLEHGRKKEKTVKALEDYFGKETQLASVKSERKHRKVKVDGAQELFSYMDLFPDKKECVRGVIVESLSAIGKGPREYEGDIEKAIEAAVAGDGKMAGAMRGASLQAKKMVADILGPGVNELKDVIEQVKNYKRDG